MSTFLEVARKCDRLASDLGPAGRAKMIRHLAVGARRDYDSEIADDLGADQAFSNWRRPPKRRVPVRVKIYHGPGDATTIGPSPVGLFFVLDRGRKAREAQARRKIEYPDGPAGRRRKYTKAKRAVSATSGRDTADRARRKIDRNTPDRANAYVAQTLRKAWR